MAIAQPLDAVAAVKQAFGDAVREVVEFRGDTTLVLDPASLVKVAQYVRDTPGLIFNYLSDISDVDYWPDYSRPGRFGVLYHLYSMLYNRRLRLKVYLPDESPEVDTLTTIWPGANFLEREIMDLMGIKFIGHPDPRRLMMEQDWDGHPHRRDYPLGYETVMFSFNAEDIMKHKPFAKE